MVYTLSIDCGLQGNLCIMSSKLEISELINMPIDKRGLDINSLILILKEFKKKYKITSCCIEQQFLLGSQGMSSGSTTVENYGVLKGILYTLGYKVEAVRAQTWQKHYKSIDVPIYSDIEVMKIKDAKKRSLSLCRLLYPDQTLLRTSKCKRLSDGISDSVLLARYYVESGVQ